MYFFCAWGWGSQVHRCACTSHSTRVEEGKFQELVFSFYHVGSWVLNSDCHAC